MASTPHGYPASPGTPGFTAVSETYEAAVMWQTHFMELPLLDPTGLIDSTAVDSGNTVTTVLRPGLVMAHISGTGWVDYDADATDGSQKASGILLREVNMYDPRAGSAADRYVGGAIAISGRAIAANLLNLDQQARNQLMRQGFVFDDKPYQIPMSDFSHVVPKAADYTVTAADHGTLFVATTGAVNFTLPTIAAGLAYEFLNSVDANMTITTPTADNMVGMNGLAFDTCTFSTAGEKIGARVRVESIYIGGTLQWVVSNISAGANTATFAG